MLIQADWFQPDAPELAPGIAVAQAKHEKRPFQSSSGGTLIINYMFKWIHDGVIYM